MSAPPLLVFDLDGTLVDTATDLIDALNLTLHHEGLDPIPVSEVGHLVGAGGRMMIERGLRYHGRVPTAADLDRLVPRFVAYYSAAIPGSSHPYPGVIAALDRFEAAGWRFAVCTNKAESLARQLLDALGLSARMAAIAGGDTFPVRKPEAGHLLGTIALAGGTATSAIMVGDSHADIAAAKNAGVPVIAVSYGYTDQPVTVFSPDSVIDRFADLWSAVERLGAERVPDGRA